MDGVALLAFAERLADAARAVTLPLFRQPMGIEVKADATPVTIADREAERVMRALIATEYPEHGVVGEEAEDFRREAEYVWALDPIDGTKSFIGGSPLYSTLIGLTRNGEPVLGVVDFPALAERWTGLLTPAHCRAAFNGEDCRVAGGDIGWSQSLLATTTLGWREGGDDDRLRRLCRGVGQVRLGGDAFSYGCVASGFCHLAADYAMKTCDYLALAPVVLAAGGVMTDDRGAPLRLQSGETFVLAAANPVLLETAIARLAVYKM